MIPEQLHHMRNTRMTTVPETLGESDSVLQLMVVEWISILKYENIAIVMGNPKHPIIMESSMIVSRIFAENSANVLWDWM